MLITLVKNYFGDTVDHLDEFKYERHDTKGIIGKIYELTNDIELANTLYEWSKNAKAFEYKGFYNEGVYSGEVEIVDRV